MRAWWTLTLLLGCQAAPPASADGVATPVASGGASEGSKACDRGMAALVDALDEPMVVEIFASRNVEIVDGFVARMERLLADVVARSGGKLAVRVRGVSDPAQRAEAEAAGIDTAPMAKDGVGAKAGMLGVVLTYRGEREVIPLISPYDESGILYWLATKIREVYRRASEPPIRVGVVDKPGVRLSDADLMPPAASAVPATVEGIVGEALPGYRLEEVRLEEGIAPELRHLIVLQASEPWTEDELARLDRFLLRGDRSMLVIAGAYQQPLGALEFVGEASTQGLDALLGRYGVGLEAGVIIDPATDMRVPVETRAGGRTTISAPGVTLVQHTRDASDDAQTLARASAAFFRLEELLFPYAAPLSIHPERQPAAQLRVLARSSPRSFVQRGRVDVTMVAEDDTSQPATGPHAIAVEVRGTLTSGDVQAPGRLLVNASPYFLTNPFARPLAGDERREDESPEAGYAQIGDAYAKQFLTASILTFKNHLDWLTHDADLLTCIDEPLPPR